jgi:E1A/CREB-binding protein
MFFRFFFTLQYAKKLGYATAHIWSCPPCEGDDYIFLCRPSGQKIPSPKQLRDWYEEMLTKGFNEGTVHNYKDIYHQVSQNLKNNWPKCRQTFTISPIKKFLF